MLVDILLYYCSICELWGDRAIFSEARDDYNPLQPVSLSNPGDNFGPDYFGDASEREKERQKKLREEEELQRFVRKQQEKYARARESEGLTFSIFIPLSFSFSLLQIFSLFYLVGTFLFFFFYFLFSYRRNSFRDSTFGSRSSCSFHCS